MVVRLKSILVLVALAAGLLTGVQTGAAGAKGVEIIDNIVVEAPDGTPIVATLMLPAGASRQRPVPVILQTHGWGGNRARAPEGILDRLLGRGYAILTWDSRGFGESGGEANVGAPGFEVSDAGALIDYLAGRPEIRQDAPGDPRLGWIGGSNAGGVQLNTAALDHRVDAIVPEISWGDLVGDLLPGEVAKQTWDALLYGAGGAAAVGEGVSSPAGPQTGNFAREIHVAFAETTTTGEISAASRKWFAFRSTVRRSDRISAPALVIQGTVDTLFPLEDGFANYLNIKRAGTPVKLIAYCSGHTLGCPYPGGASGDPDGESRGPFLYEDRIVAWLDRYVKGRDVATGPEVEWQAQDGYYYSAPRYPLPHTRRVTAKSVTTPALVGPGGTGGDGVADGNPAPDSEIGTSAFRARILGPKDARRVLFGTPEVELKGTLTGAAGHVFLELIDVGPDGERVTVDDQTMPLRLETGPFAERLSLHGVAWILAPGHALELEVTTGSSQYSIPRTGPYGVQLEATTELPLAPGHETLRSTGS